MSALWNKLIARIVSGGMASFRKTPIAFHPDDLREFKVSFFQHGEDLLVADHLMNRPGTPKGIYIDAVCFDPFRFSNTRLLKLCGWRGINIDAGSDVIEKFNLQRLSDENVCAALSDRESDMILRGEPGHAGRRLVASAEITDFSASAPVRTTTLAAVLAASRFRDEPVDLLDIDCECHHIEVLQGFPFDRVRPVLICVEAHTQPEADGLGEKLQNLDYIRIAVRGPTIMFRDRKSIPPNQPEWVRIAEL